MTGKMTFWGDKCLIKVDHATKIGVLNIPAPDDHLSSLTPNPDFMDRGHLDRENDILGRQVFNES